MHEVHIWNFLLLFEVLFLIIYFFYTFLSLSILLFFYQFLFQNKIFHHFPLVFIPLIIPLYYSNLSIFLLHIHPLLLLIFLYQYYFQVYYLLVLILLNLLMIKSYQMISLNSMTNFLNLAMFLKDFFHLIYLVFAYLRNYILESFFIDIIFFPLIQMPMYLEMYFS